MFEFVNYNHFEFVNNHYLFTNGGTNDNGNISSLFFHPSNRNDVLDLFDHKNQTERDNMDDILTRMNVCLR